jgi:uncharacterized protein (DUF58 family)
MPGIHPSRVHGASAEFSEYRPYRHGDDLRRIDWRLFARSDRAHIRISDERAVTPTCLVLDASASMAFPDGGSSKWTLARRLTVALSSIVQAGGDPVGIMVAGNPAATIPPRSRRGVVTEVIQKLRDVPVLGDSPLAPALAAAARSSLRVAVVSDFLGDLDDTLRTASELIAAGREVHALHIIAAEEMDPPASVSLVADPELADLRRHMVGAARSGYERAFAEWRDSTARRWLASGAMYRVIVAGQEPVDHTVRRIVHDGPAISPTG